MSEYEALRKNIEDVGEAVASYARTVNTHVDAIRICTDQLWADNAELRDEINAVANRVENLTRAVMADPAEVAQAIVNDANRSTLREVREEES